MPILKPSGMALYKICLFPTMKLAFSSLDEGERAVADYRRPKVLTRILIEAFTGWAGS